MDSALESCLTGISAGEVLAASEVKEVCSVALFKKDYCRRAASDFGKTLYRAGAACFFVHIYHDGAEFDPAFCGFEAHGQLG